MAGKKLTIVEPEAVAGDAERMEREDAGPVLGSWHWVTSKNYRGKKETWLGCVMKVGSNFVELHSPKIDNSTNTIRVHFNEVEEMLRPEPDADAYIQRQVAYYNRRVAELLGDVQEVTRKLGVVPQTIENQSGAGQNALMVISTQVDTKAYKNALVEAKDKTLPDLFKQIEEANKGLAGWMTAPTLPMQASIGPMKDNIGAIEDRIYTIELYAGLTEDAEQCCEGDPADISEKLHVMQRRLYMDEESLLSYTGGGLEFKGIGAFDEWISQPENRNRLLPFPRTLAAFRVRRNDKDREDGGDLWKAWVNFELEQADKLTFLYVRNGDQVWRITCNFDFDEMIFPDQATFDPTQPMMVKMFAHRVDKMITRNAWEVMRDKQIEQARLRDEWEKANPNAHSFDNPHRESYFDSYKGWHPVDPSSVYFDEASDHISAEMKRYNRVAVIIQGLFDRSPVLVPHGRVKVWDPESFMSAIELVYDATTLTYGEAPDFEAYRTELNASIDENSIVTGQQDYWMRVEAKKENERRERDWRNRDRRNSHYRRFAPYGNPGPGLVSRMAEWKPRSRKATFRWEREKQGWRSYGETTGATVTVPAEELFNVSSYTVGDFKRFFADPRTRQDYLKWAPLMLAAEDYHAGKIKLNEGQKMATDASYW